MKTVHPAASPPYVLGSCGFTKTGRELMLAQQVRREELNKKTFKAPPHPPRPLAQMYFSLLSQG